MTPPVARFTLRTILWLTQQLSCPHSQNHMSADHNRLHHDDDGCQRQKVIGRQRGADNVR